MGSASCSKRDEVQVGERRITRGIPHVGERTLAGGGEHGVPAALRWARFGRGCAMLLLTYGVCLASSTVTRAASSKVQLSAKEPTVEVGKDAAVEVLIENAPTIYGADVRIVFDPRMLEVVDADQKVPGVQIEPGSFLDPKRSFALQHQVNNDAGRADYALTLVRPAPPASGNGQLAQITFRGKAEGTTTISVTQGQYGTQTGEVINATLGTLELEVFAKDGRPRSAVGRAVGTLAKRVSTVVVLPEPGPRARLVVAGAVLVGLLGIWRGHRRRSAPPSPQ